VSSQTPSIREAALQWANVVKKTLPLYMKDCNVLDDLEEFLRSLSAQPEQPTHPEHQGSER